MSSEVKKREIFYLGGYDPRGARSYYNLYKTEAKKNAQVDTLNLDIKRRQKETEHIQSWSINNVDNNQKIQVETKYNFLEWDDIIRKNWKKNFFNMLLDMFSFIRIYFLSGLIVKLAKLSPQGLRPMLYPIFYMVIVLLLAYLLSTTVIHYTHTAVSLPIALLISLIPVYYLIRFFHNLGNKIAVYWVLRSMMFYGNYIKDDHTLLDERLNHFALNIRECIKDSKKNNVDEVLIIAHSAGTVVLMELLYYVLHSIEKNDENILKNVSILTLGQCIPLVSFLDEAIEYRDKMKFISNYSLNWIDITAPADEVSLALVDYFKESGISSNHSPLYLSPRFHTLFDSTKYKKIKRDLYLIHFLYIMSADKVGPYNYFQITAGNQRLHNRLKEKTT
jgi:hypothetical protein